MAAGASLSWKSDILKWATYLVGVSKIFARFEGFQITEFANLSFWGQWPREYWFHIYIWERSFETGTCRVSVGSI